MQAKRTSINLDPEIVADAKIALWEAQELSALYSVALTKEIEELRKRTVNASSMRASELTWSSPVSCIGLTIRTALAP